MPLPVNYNNEFQKSFEAATYEHETYGLYVSNKKYDTFMIAIRTILDRKHIDPYDWRHKTKEEFLGTATVNDMC